MLVQTPTRFASLPFFLCCRSNKTRAGGSIVEFGKISDPCAGGIMASLAHPQLHQQAVATTSKPKVVATIATTKSQQTHTLVFSLHAASTAATPVPEFDRRAKLALTASSSCRRIYAVQTPDTLRVPFDGIARPSMRTSPVLPSPFAEQKHGLPMGPAPYRNRRRSKTLPVKDGTVLPAPRAIMGQWSPIQNSNFASKSLARLGRATIVEHHPACRSLESRCWPDTGLKIRGYRRSARVELEMNFVRTRSTTGPCD
ncbi:hypothetical protein CC2G_012609 [Coprinopsis cinerea AmutBmut pab1-1]|nr:hypothetical protein CC2G_012609 [Coprinopsis cinerea AmutBmut pab1-1]